MSGGSYEYLCYADTLEDILQKVHQLIPMADRLTELGYSDAAKETEEVDLLLRQFNRRISARIDRLKGVWKAVEWLDSCDSGQDYVDDQILRYRQENP